MTKGSAERAEDFAADAPGRIKAVAARGPSGHGAAYLQYRLRKNQNRRCLQSMSFSTLSK